MKLQFLITLSLLISFITSCEKMEYNPPKSEGKIIEVFDEHKNTIGKYFYDKNGIVKESWFEEDFYTHGEKAEYTYTYDSENRLIKKCGYEPGIIYMSSFTGAMGKDVSMKFIYNEAGKLLKVTTSYTYDDDKLNFSQEIHYAYPSDSIFEIRNYYSYMNDTTGYYRTEFHVDKRGNIVEIKSFSKEKAKLERMYYFERYTYDDKLNPFRTTYKPENSSANNVLTIEKFYFGPDGVPSNIIPKVFTYEYEYNSNGYPTKQTLTNPNKTVQIKYFKY